MNTRSFLKIYLLICIFPVWLISEKILSTTNSIFFIPYIIFYIVLILFLDFNQDNKITIFIISLLTVFALDQNLLINKNLFKPNFEFLNGHLLNIYLADLILILALILIFYLILTMFKIKGIKIISSFILVIFIFNIG